MEIPNKVTTAVIVVAAILFSVGLWGIDLQAKQARDTTRALDLEDLETALQRTLAATGTLPPAEMSTWCGVVNDPKNTAVRERIETALRQTSKYAKPAKPFPADPRFAGSTLDYLYWKTSPVSFELASVLEADNSNTRENICDSGVGYDYSITSVRRFAL